MAKKYQIFVSSTFEDLVDQRQAVVKTILEMSHIPVGMEMFCAGDEGQWQYIQRTIDDIDYYIVIIAHRYGSVTPEGISYTEKEYDYAASKNIPIIGFMIDKSVSWPPGLMDADFDTKAKLENFKAKVSTKMISHWKSSEDLSGKVAISLISAISRYPRSGWIQATGQDKDEIYEEVTRLSKENAKLRADLAATISKNEEESNKEVSELHDILLKDERKFHVSLGGKEGWSEGPEVNSMKLFAALAPGLLTELSTVFASKLVAVAALDSDKVDQSGKWSVPRNQIDSFFADLNCLGLVEPTRRYHAANDDNTYWVMTEKGRSLYHQLRRRSLAEGVTQKIHDTH